ncbi:MAG: hypothetical protein Harvfovirus12_14 [Harvfovirus sp.]|uniref:Uncharacterized protein n=1 Tax=Harvfovirus sp. TaxID=2487768 RepID=A0A3G5A187_9VIRU|nr:MAG: hypothetical protein Harvfovirus12_14 [Harvfovirus sp.]
MAVETYYEVPLKAPMLKFFADAKELFKINFPLEVKGYRLKENEDEKMFEMHANSAHTVIWIRATVVDIGMAFYCYRAVGICQIYVNNGKDAPLILYTVMMKKIFTHCINNDIKSIAGAYMYKFFKKTYDKYDSVVHKLLTDALLMRGYELEYKLFIKADKIIYEVVLKNSKKTLSAVMELKYAVGMSWKETVNNFIQLMLDVNYNKYTISGGASTLIEPVKKLK